MGRSTTMLHGKGDEVNNLGRERHGVGQIAGDDCGGGGWGEGLAKMMNSYTVGL